MKNLLTVFILLSSSMSFAGLPQEDFVVDLTRESFRDGSRPSETDLYFNFQWVCGTYKTSPGTLTGTTGITLGEVNFVKENGSIINKSFYYAGRVPLSATENEYSSYVLNESGEITSYYFVRKNHDGILVEKAIPATSPSVPSVVAPELQAIAYSYCLPFDSNSKAPKVMNVPWSDVYTNQ